MKIQYFSKEVDPTKIDETITALVGQGWDFMQMSLAAPKKWMLLFRDL